MLPWVALGLLLPVAVLMLAFWRQFLLGGVGSDRQDHLLATVWGPLLASAGLLGLVWDHDSPLRGHGSLAIGTGAMVFAILVGVLLLAFGHSAWRFQDRIPLAWSVAGVLLVLIGAAGRVSHTVGLIALALGMVLLWLNLMTDQRDRAQPRVSSGESSLVIAFLAALVLAACARLAPVAWLVPIGLVLALTSLGVVGLVARYRDAVSAIHTAGWFAVLLPCFGLGLLGQDMLMEIVRADMMKEIPGRPPRFEHTGGLLEPGLVLLGTILVLAGSGRWSPNWRSPASFALVAAGILGLLILLVEASG
ncbi:MAG: hypothetical protein VX527_05320 [Planctomycetota bacterium]|nr:hypothetical protein [Planctomycetota bacterium]